nr:hypothetical protein [Elizabethkingia sp. ASV34]
MKLNYYVLWVEDDNSWYSTTAELIKDQITEYGFTPQIERKRNLDEVVDEIANTGLKKFDILLIDFNLRNSSDGGSVIDHIRNNNILTDVIFYSSDKQLIIDAIKEHLFEGVYHSDRNEIEDKFERVFKTTIKKIEEINSMRGLIVGETSELDALIEEHLLKYTCSPYIDAFDIDSFIEKKIFLNQTDRIDRLKNEYQNNGIIGILPHLEAIKKWELLRGILKVNKAHKECIPEFLSLNSAYQTEVIEIRNKFAHAKVVMNDNGKEVLKSHIGNQHFEFGEKEFMSIRESLIKHRDALILLKD